MRRFVFTILIIFSICVLTNCSHPIGTLEGGGASSGYMGDPMWLVPKRQLYQIDERYKRYQDFQVFAVINGGVVEISAEDPNITVTITVNKGLTSERIYTDAMITSDLQFNHVGRHIVTVGYIGRKGDYSVEVFSPNNGNSIGGGDGGIGIIWLD